MVDSLTSCQWSDLDVSRQESLPRESHGFSIIISTPWSPVSGSLLFTLGWSFFAFTPMTLWFLHPRKKRRLLVFRSLFYSYSSSLSSSCLLLVKGVSSNVHTLTQNTQRHRLQVSPLCYSNQGIYGSQEKSTQKEQSSSLLHSFSCLSRSLSEIKFNAEQLDNERQGYGYTKQLDTLTYSDTIEGDLFFRTRDVGCQMFPWTVSSRGNSWQQSFSLQTWFIGTVTQRVSWQQFSRREEGFWL